MVSTEDEYYEVRNFWFPLWVELCEELGLELTDEQEKKAYDEFAYSLVFRHEGQIISVLKLEEGTVSNIYVHGDFRRRGVARKMLQMAEERGAFRALVEQNNEASKQFFESIGWRPSGELYQSELLPSSLTVEYIKE